MRQASLLPCKAISVEDLSKTSQAELEAHLTVVYKALHKASAVPSGPASSSSSAADKLNLLGTVLVPRL